MTSNFILSLYKDIQLFKICLAKNVLNDFQFHVILPDKFFSLKISNIINYKYSRYRNPNDIVTKY